MSDRLPDSYESLFDRAITHVGQGNIQDAIDLVSRIVNRLSKLGAKTMARNPGRQVLLMNSWDLWVEFLRWEGRFEEALAVCEQHLAKRPDLVTIQTRIWMLTIEMGDVQAGLEGLRQLAQDRQNFEARVVLGIAYRQLEQYQQAEAAFQSALSSAQSNQESAQVYQELVRLYQQMDRSEDLQEAWSMCVVLEPERADDNHTIYRWLIERGESDKAKMHLGREHNEIRSLFYQGLIDWHADRRASAQERWLRVLDLDLDEDAPGGIAEWMEAALRCGKPDAVIDLVDERDDLAISLDSMTMGGIAQAMRGEIDDAVHTFQDVIKILKRRWPSLQAIPGWWKLVLEVVPDEETQQAIAGYFEPQR